MFYNTFMIFCSNPSKKIETAPKERSPQTKQTNGRRNGRHCSARLHSTYAGNMRLTADILSLGIGIYAGGADAQNRPARGKAARAVLARIHIARATFIIPELPAVYISLSGASVVFVFI